MRRRFEIHRHFRESNGTINIVEPNMKLFPKARNIMLAAYHDDASRAGLGQKERHDKKSALKVMLDEFGPDWLKQSPSNEPTSPEDIAELDRWLGHMRRTHPRLKSVESRTRAAVQQSGIMLPDGRGNLPLANDWLAIKFAIAVLAWRTVLPLAYDANNKSIAPLEMTDDVLLDFANFHLAKCDRKSGIQTVRAIASTWNEFAPPLGLAILAMPVPYLDRDWYMPDQREFADSLLEELDRCVASWMTKPRRGRTLSAKTAKAARYLVLLTIAAFCKSQNQSVREIRSLVEFISIGNLVIAFESMIMRAQIKNPAAMRTDGAYCCCRAVRDAALVILPTAYELHQSLKKLVKRLASGLMSPVDADDRAPAKRRPGSSTVKLPSFSRR